MAFDFDGVNEWLDAADVATGPPFAVSLWFWLDVAATNNEMFSTAAGTSALRRGFNVKSTGLVECFTFDGVLSAATTSTAASTGVWNHALAVWESTSSRKVWLNGGGEGTNSALRSLIAANTMRFGAATDGSRDWNGRLAELAVWTGSAAGTMDINDAAILAAGYSPPCLTNLLGNLAFYHPIVRDLNWNSKGPTLTAAGAPTVIEHPRAIPLNSRESHIRAPGTSGSYRPSGAIVPLALNLER